MPAKQASLCVYSASGGGRVAPTTGAGVGAPLAGNAARRLPSRSTGRTQPGRVRAAILPGSYRAREAAPDCGWPDSHPRRGMTAGPEEEIALLMRAGSR